MYLRKSISVLVVENVHFTWSTEIIRLFFLLSRISDTALPLLVQENSQVVIYIVFVDFAATSISQKFIRRSH